MCFCSVCGTCPTKLTFRYNSMLNFIQVSFCFLLFLGSELGLGLGIGLGFGIGNLKIFKNI